MIFTAFGDPNAFPPTTEDDARQQPAAVWRCVERRLWQRWPGRIRQCGIGRVGDGEPTDWLTIELARQLTALDAPAFRIFTACRIETRDEGAVT